MTPNEEEFDSIPPEATEDDLDEIVEEVPTGEVNIPLPTEEPETRLNRLREKCRTLEEGPGVYLFKDVRGVVIYVGKSRSLRDRVGSYFVPSTDLGQFKQKLLDYIADFDVLVCDSEVDALLMENRLIKDVKPRFNARMTDGKSYPYIEITTNEDFPGVYVTRKPQASGVKHYGPFTSGYALKQALIYLQRAFKFRTCHLEIHDGDPKRRWFRPCLLYAIGQCTAPCADRISKQDYETDINRLRRFLETSRGDVLKEMTEEMSAASAAKDFEKAAVLRDQIKALEALSERGKTARGLQPELFFQDRQAGLKQLQEILQIPEPIRSIEAIDIAHFQGQATVGSLVSFIDGRPFKDGYRRFRIKHVTGIDDYRCIQEVLTRHYRHAGIGEALYPDVILIDGGLGQLHAALDAFNRMQVAPPLVISLAKREEEIFVQGHSLPFKLPRTSAALKLLQFARDEAHRFAQSYHHLLIAKRQFADAVKAGRRAPAKARRSGKASKTDPDMKVLNVQQVRKITSRMKKEGKKA
ncbi:MAG TPA: excinuclease ABC subunit UvrC [Phycisphaerae bacterium]|nr:excinuclease ABC subunit UvrC [Phycisphaerae bacterium]